METDVKSLAISTPRKETVEDPVCYGRVEYFNSEKGYGFIKEKETPIKYFFHIKYALTPITEGAVVTFETERGPKGPNAVKITAIK